MSDLSAPMFLHIGRERLHCDKDADHVSTSSMRGSSDNFLKEFECGKRGVPVGKRVIVVYVDKTDFIEAILAEVV